MLEGSVFGKGKSAREIIEAGGGRGKYLLRRIFPEKKIMFGTYQKLDKAPYLLPYYYALRLYERWKYNREKVKKELKQIHKKDK